ncbi:MAG: hypothetical protein ACFFDT_35195 [Candidatus Hodarchaeota archaeon]
MSSYSIEQLKFYDGRKYFIDEKRLTKFEINAFIDRYYSGRDMEVGAMAEDLGSLAIFFTNVQPWVKEIPDIDDRSARIFTLWAEDKNTKEIMVIFRGFFMLAPFKMGKKSLQDYYYFSETVPYYPIAVISQFSTVFSDRQHLMDLLDRIEEEIQKNWSGLRQRVIETLEKTDLWKRYVLSFEKIIHFSFMCSSFDRELVEALRKRSYRMTGVLHVLASPTPSYDQAMITSHIEEASKRIKEADKD